MDGLFECGLFIVGLVFGSFLNVCISRIPNDESVVSPPSHCPHCGKPIRWYDNVPLIGYIVLRGRCRDCGERISLRYPAVELLTAALFAGCYAYFGPDWTTLKFCIFSFLLVGLIFMDAETGLLPREFTYTGIVVGLAFSWFVPTDFSATAFLFRVFDKQMPGANGMGLIDATIAALVGAAFFYLAWALYYLVRKKHGLGFGDIALIAMAGAFLGLKLVVLVIVLAPLATIACIPMLFLMERFRRQPSDGPGVPLLSREIPFGVALGGCSLLVMFAGEAMWRWYLGYFR